MTVGWEEEVGRTNVIQLVNESKIKQFFIQMKKYSQVSHKTKYRWQHID